MGLKLKENRIWWQNVIAASVDETYLRLVLRFLFAAAIAVAIKSHSVNDFYISTLIFIEIKWLVDLRKDQ